MFKLSGDQAQHFTEVAILPECGGHQVMALVDDEEVPGKMRRSFGCSACGQELLEKILLPKIGIRRDDPPEGSPVIRIHAQPLPQFVRFISVDDVKVE